MEYFAHLISAKLKLRMLKIILYVISFQSSYYNKPTQFLERKMGFLKFIFVYMAVFMLLLNEGKGYMRSGRRRACRYNPKLDTCVDILPLQIRKNLRQLRMCPNFDLQKERYCAKEGGACHKIVLPKGQRMCECRKGERDF